MKCSWQTFLSPLKGQCPYQALLGLPQTTRFTGGFDYPHLTVFIAVKLYAAFKAQNIDIQEHN
jgi:hypothetical protein